MSDKQVAFSKGLQSLMGIHHFIFNSSQLGYYVLMKQQVVCLQLTKVLS